MRIDPTAPIPDWSALEAAFEYDPNMIVGYYDRQTGEVEQHMPDDDYAPEEQEATLARIEGEPERFLEIEPVPSREGYAWMEKFVETVRDARLAGRLERALAGQRPFRRFKDALDGAELERWYAFQRGMLRRHIAAWLEENGVAVGAAPPWPELAEAPEPGDDELRRLAHEFLDRVPGSHLSRVAGLLKSLAEEA